jgi:hypothetical protein
MHRIVALQGYDIPMQQIGGLPDLVDQTDGPIRTEAPPAITRRPINDRTRPFDEGLRTRGVECHGLPAHVLPRALHEWGSRT